MVKSRPYIILSAALSIDGKIATRTGDSELSSKKDKRRVHKLRAKVDAILVGINTIKHDDPLLTVKHAEGKNPLRIILDSHGTINTKSRVVQTAKKIPTIVVVSKKASRKRLGKLKKYPLEVIVEGENKTDIKKLLNILRKRKIKKILLEGGGTVNWEFVQQDLINEVIITIEPCLVGGKDAISLVEGKGFPLISKSLKLKLHKINKLGNELVIHYLH